MDTSETYIKMCEKAEEIQTEVCRCLLPDDYVVYRIVRNVTTIWRHERGGLTTTPYSQTFIWLPRQDQLQEIIKEVLAERYGTVGDSKNETLLDCFYNFSKYTYRYVPALNLTPVQATYSMEQLWLAFVMKEMHNKVWSGEEWK